MLKRFQAMVMNHLQAASYSLAILLQKPGSTFMTIGVVAITLTLPMAFWVVNAHFQQVALDWQQRAHISLYVAVDTAPTQVDALLKRVQQIAGVKQASLTTPEKGLKAFEQQEGLQGVAQYLPKNPLPAVIEIVPLKWATTPVLLQQLAEQLRQLPSVDQVSVQAEWIERLYAILAFMKHFLQSVMVLLSTGVVLIIGNTLRLTLQHRQEEIHVLKLIGATDAYIMRPFLYAGMWYGFLGAAIALIIVSVFLLTVGHQLQTWLSLYQMHLPRICITLQQGYALLFFSAILGVFSAICFTRGLLAVMALK